MENQVKVNLWASQLLDDVNKSSLDNFSSNNENNLRMINHQYDVIFSLLSKGKTIKVANLDLTNKTISQALNDAEREDSSNNKTSIYFDCDYKKQNEKLKQYVDNKNVFLTFGLLDYFEDNKMKIKSAPLVLMPVRIEFLQNRSFYQISCVNHEVFLNDLLINKLLSTQRIDLSYPLENDFSLIEYLTYISTKVRNNHFSVNNGCFITSLDLHSLYNYRDFNARKEQICSLPLVKNISYLNAEFFNLNKRTSLRLDNHYISLLDLDNDEYKIIRRLNLRDNIVIKTNSLENKHHVFTNVLYDYLLNNKKILITYNDEEAYHEIIKVIKENKLREFSLVLSQNRTSKEGLIEKLLKQDKLDFDVKLLDEDKINETVDTYYLLKNNFKKFINGLRKNNEPMNLSINKAILEYYDLYDVSDMEIEIPNVDLIDEKKLKEYLEAISAFVQAIDSLKCNYKNHPFYGFNNLRCTQTQYLELKEKLILLSNEFEPANSIFNLLDEKYHIPKPNNLMEMKCILNIIALIPDCVNINPEFFELENENAIINSFNNHNKLVNDLNDIRNKIISLYEDKAFLIDYKELGEQLKNVPLKRNIIKSYREYFLSNVKIDEDILRQVYNDLSEYYSLKEQINNLVKENEKFKEFYYEGMFDVNSFKQKMALINSFKDNCKFLEKNSLSYSYKRLSVFDETSIKTLFVEKKKAQIAFNHLLNLINYIEKYFDKTLVDFSVIPFVDLENKVNNASKNFYSINDYLNFYLSYKKLNKLIPSLADELLKQPRSDLYILMFLKCFYYQYANLIMKKDMIFKNYFDENFLKSMNNYQGYNDERLEIIDALIKNNLKINLQKNALVLRSLEIPYLKELKKQELNVLPLNKLLLQAKNIIQSMYPIMIVPLNEISTIMCEQDINFDVNIVFPNDELQTKNAVSSISRANQQIIFDNKFISDEEELIKKDNEYFTYAALQSLNVVNYVSSSYKFESLKANVIDVSLKKHLIKKLQNKNLLVSSDVQTPYGTIDILVKIPQTTRPTAIILDRLNYYSLEAGLNSFASTNEKVTKLGFACYQIIIPNYFQNEKNEFKKLIDFIITNTIQEKNVQKVNRIKPLVDVLFEEYKKPEDVYYRIQDKNNKSNNEVMMEFLKECAPISREQLLSCFNDTGLITLASLQMDKIVNISNGFVFLTGERVNFKRVNRDSDYCRLLSTISNEEIQDGIIKIASETQLSVDDMIKLILKTIGMKKMNHNQYFRIENIINDLLDDNKIILKDNLLMVEEQNKIIEQK